MESASATVEKTRREVPMLLLRESMAPGRKKDEIAIFADGKTNPADELLPMSIESGNPLRPPVRVL